MSGNDLAAGLQLAIWDELVNTGTTSGPLSYYGESAAVDNLVAYFLSDAATNSAGGGGSLGRLERQCRGFT